MSPVMDTLASTYGDRLKIVKMEVDPNPEAVKECKVEGVPALRLFQGGNVVESSEGALPKPKVEAILAPYL
jgi:thioredoxin 1